MNEYNKLAKIRLARETASMAQGKLAGLTTSLPAAACQPPWSGGGGASADLTPTAASQPPGIGVGGASADLTPAAASRPLGQGVAGASVGVIQSAASQPLPSAGRAPTATRVISVPKMSVYFNNEDEDDFDLIGDDVNFNAPES